jgi:peptidoglycan/LPS O-acetylase OafA/YrhL
LTDVKVNAHAARNPSERLAFLDGIRGWGAMVVLVFHLFVDQGLRATPEASQLLHFFS